jgi:ABC-type lipoprotein export system ATPase subunit
VIVPGPSLISCRNLKRTYPATTVGEPPLTLLFPNIEIPAGRRIALLGVSGAGKSTFLNLVAGLDSPTRDSAQPSILYRFSDGTVADMADREKPFPRQRLGFVFQEGHLITDASAGINAALPGLLNGIPGRDTDLQHFMDALELPSDSVGREAWRLSGGQKQRVAILRALFHCPQIIFADEPTSNLDKRTAAAIMQLFVEYQEQDLTRTLFWATHDLPLAAEFATEFLIVRIVHKPDGQDLELEGPLPNLGPSHLKEIEAKVYSGAIILNASPPLSQRPTALAPNGHEVPYTQAKLGCSLTFARRGTPESLGQVGRLGRWMASIESRPPPILLAGAEMVRLYRRFSDHAVAGALGFSILMLSFVFLGLQTMAFVRNQAMSDPLACNVTAGAPDATVQSASNMELTPSLITRINAMTSWRNPKLWLDSWVNSGAVTGEHTNPCGEAEQLVFGRNITTLDLGIERDRQCIALGLSLKTLVASLAEPAISVGVNVLVGAGLTQRRMGEMLHPDGGSNLQTLSQAPNTGEALFITETLREHLYKILRTPEFLGLPPSEDPSGVALCVPGRSGNPPLHLGGIVSGLPNPRGIPYDALIARGAFLSPQSDTFDQAVFYTNPERAGLLNDYLMSQGFAFSHEEVQRMIAASQKFTAIGILIWVVGGTMIVSTFFFLFTCVVAFMEKNARPNAVLMAYGLTRNMLSRQILWRLGAVLPYAILILFAVGLGFGITFRFVFSMIGLPLPSMFDVLWIGALAVGLTLVGAFIVVHISVRIWWRKHGSIAQELS